MRTAPEGAFDAYVSAIEKMADNPDLESVEIEMGEFSGFVARGAVVGWSDERGPAFISVDGSWMETIAS